MIRAIVFKSWLEIIILVLIVIVSGLTGYELGRDYQPTDQMILRDNSLIVSNQTNLVPSSLPIESHTSDSYQVVYGSVNGSKYYNFGCKSGDRIKEENRIFFADQGEALLAGYEPAVNCNF